MSKVYILCKENKYEGNIEHIIKVFSDRTQALKELYEHVGFYDKNYNDPDKRFADTFFYDNNYVILVKTVDQESEEESEEEYENVYDFRDITDYITRNIWQKVIDELPEKNTLRNLIKFQHEVREYKNQEKKVSKEIVESKKNMDIRKELNEKLDELNIKMPKLQL